MISDSQTARTRAKVEKQLMTTRATQQRILNPSSDNRGGKTGTYSTLRTVYVYVGTPTGNQRVIAGKLEAISVVTILVPAGTDVLDRDRFVIGTRTYEVMDSGGGKTIELARPLVCVEVA